MKFFLCLWLSIFGLFHIATLPAQTCNCPEQFAFLTEKMATNYAGYRDKVNATTQPDFERHTVNYRVKTATATADTTCFRLLTEWALFFRDQHVQLSYKAPPDDPTAIRLRFAGAEKIRLDETATKAQLDQPGRDSVEGIWEMQGGNYRVALLRQPTPLRDYAAVILRADSIWWMPGQVKFELKKAAQNYTARFFMRDHTIRELIARQQGNTLAFSGFSTWQRVYPGDGKVRQAGPQQIFTLKKLNDRTVLLTVPTMNESVRRELDSLITANRPLLAATPNLIIDCRGNGGGSDITYYPLKPYLYTQPVTIDGMQLWATPDNADKFAQMGKDKNFPWTWRLYGRHTARKMRRNEGKFIGKTDQSTEKMKHALPYPQRVAVLIDGGCGSSCEQFILFAQQSKKTTLIGQNTGGVLDYGNLHFLTFPDGRFQLGYPTSRSGRVAAGRGIDNVGIAPTVRLTEKVGDWVDWAQQFLEEKDDISKPQ